MSTVAQLTNSTAILPPQLKPAPHPDYVWDFSKGADFSTVTCRDPDVRIESDKRKESPGRTIGVQKKNPRRNTIDYQDPIDGLIKRAEGTLEMKGLYQDFRDPTVVKISPQFGPCYYVDLDGKTRWTYWDARVEYADGRVILKDFKPAAVAIRRNHQQLVEYIFQQVPAHVADEARLITDRDLPAWAVANGRLIHSVLCDGNWTMLQEMTAAAHVVSESTTMEEFCRPFGGVQRTFRTAVYLLAKRKLWHRPGLIEASTPIGPIIHGDGLARLDTSLVPGPGAFAAA